MTDKSLPFLQDAVVAHIKPLSVNAAWKGQRFKTDDYKLYEQIAALTLPKNVEIPPGDLFVHYEFGVSSPNADCDNHVKPFQDILQKRYGFNDRVIMGFSARKRLVPKGAEYVAFRIEPDRRG